MKFLFLKSLLVLVGLLFIINKNYSIGIIIADEKQQTKLFNSDEDTVTAFADSISKNYDRVILHLGRTFVFRRGNIYSSEKSKKNLVLFCNALQSKNVKVYLWILDSYGGEKFMDIYDEYKEIIDEDISTIDSLQIPYVGIVIDLEWINRKNFTNNDQFIQILKHIRKRIGKKELGFFASLTNDENKNSKRGYDISKILKYADYPVVMLYPNDGDFYVERKKIIPKLDDARIKELKKYYEKQNWKIAISLKKAYILKDHDNLTVLNITKNIKDSVLAKLSFSSKKEYKYYSMSYFNVDKGFYVNDKKGETLFVKKNDVIGIFEATKNSIISPDDFIWEHFNIKQF